MIISDSNRFNVDYGDTIRSPTGRGLHGGRGRGPVGSLRDQYQQLVQSSVDADEDPAANTIIEIAAIFIMKAIPGSFCLRD